MSNNQYIKEGERLKKARLDLGKKPEEMANALKISTNAYYQLESGRSGYSMSMLKLLGSEFNISLNYLLLSNGLIFLNNIQIIENEILVDMSQETTPVSQKDMLKMIQDLQKKVSEIMKSK